MLQNALFLRDISSIERQFKQLTSYLDTGCILSAIGLEGTPASAATREGLSLLATAGAKLAVFESTVDEVRRILFLYECRVGTKAGRESLFATSLARYFLKNRCTPADIREASSLVVQNLASLGIQVRRYPVRQASFTLDERKLTLELKRPEESELERRVVHDVDCIASVLTLRKGQDPKSFDNAVAVFTTTNSRLVRTVAGWWDSQDQTGVLPIIHHVRLTNLAWLKKPAGAKGLKMSELVALCWAAIQPSRGLWQRFISHLNKLEEGGRLSNDEAVAVVVSSFTDKYLGDLEQHEESPDAEALDEVLERVKASYKGKMQVEIDQKTQELERSQEAHRQLEYRLRGQARRLASLTSWSAYWTMSVMVLAGLALSLPGVMSQIAAWASGVAWVLIILFGIFSFVNVQRGFALERLRRSVEERLAVRFEKLLSVPGDGMDGDNRDTV